jgi:hypothetical protein
VDKGALAGVLHPRFLQQRLPASKIVITDVRDGSQVPFDRP